MPRIVAREWGVIGLCVMLLVAAVGIATMPRGEPLELRYIMQAGQELVYESSFTMDQETSMDTPGAEPFGMSFQATMRLRVVDVEPDGTRTLEITSKIDDMEMPGMPGENVDPPEPTTARLRIAPDGRVLDAGDDTEVAGLPVPSHFMTELPAEQIRPGERWRTETELRMGNNATRTASANRFEGYEDTPFGRAARIRSEASGPVDMGFDPSDMPDYAPSPPAGFEPPEMSVTMKATSVALVLVSDGSLVRSTTDTVMEMTMRFPEGEGMQGQESTSRGHMTMNIVRIE